MGNYFSARGDKTQPLSTDISNEKTLCVTPSELVSTCIALGRAQVDVIASSVPDPNDERSFIWVNQSDKLKSLLESGSLGPHLAQYPYISKGTKETILEPPVTAVGLHDKCKCMASKGTKVIATTPMGNLGTEKKIYHL